MKKSYSHIEKYEAYKEFRKKSLKVLSENKLWAHDNVKAVTKYFLDIAVNNHAKNVFSFPKKESHENYVNNEFNVLIRQIVMASEVSQKDEAYNIILEAKRISELVLVNKDSGLWIESCSMQDFSKLLKIPEEVSTEGQIATEIEKVLASMRFVKNKCQELTLYRNKYGRKENQNEVCAISDWIYAFG